MEDFIKETAGKVEAKIRERGWCKGNHEDINGRVCLMGAVNLACTHNSRRINSETYRFRNHLISELGNPLQWNDDPKRTKKDVLTMLHRISEGKRALPWLQRMWWQIKLNLS